MKDSITKFLLGKRTYAILILSFLFFLTKGIIWLLVLHYGYTTLTDL